MDLKNERFLEVYHWLRKNKKIKDQKDLAEKVGVSATTISRIKNGKAKPDIETLLKLNETFGNIFRMSYFDGFSSEMFADTPTAPLTPSDPFQDGIAAEPSPVQSFEKGKPYYNVDFALGFDILENDQTQHPDYLIDFRPYNNCDLYCNAYGNSMHPTISSGDIVALKRIADFRYLINGEIYAIVTSNGLRTIKRVHDNGDTFTLIADNPTVADQTIPKSLVTHAFQVRGTIKMF